jgi:DNA-binding MarR family transcriptional regulator
MCNSEFMSAPRRIGPTEDESAELERLAALLDEPAGVLAALWEAHHLDAPVPATQLRVLFVVERHGSVNLTGIAEEVGALLSSASRLCGRLEATGLLERVPGPDRRAISVRLSAQGTALLDGLREARRHAFVQVLARMDPADQQTLLSGLRHFHEAALRTGEPNTGFSLPA